MVVADVGRTQSYARCSSRTAARPTSRPEGSPHAHARTLAANHHLKTVHANVRWRRHRPEPSVTMSPSREASRKRTRRGDTADDIQGASPHDDAEVLVAANARGPAAVAYTRLSGPPTRRQRDTVTSSSTSALTGQVMNARAPCGACGQLTRPASRAASKTRGGLRPRPWLFILRPDLHVRSEFGWDG